MILAHLTDLHIRPSGSAAYRVVETNTLAERAIRRVASMRTQPDAVVISGDLTDCGLAAEYAVLLGLLRRHLSHRPVYVIPGNHDRRAAMRAGLAGYPGLDYDPEFIHYVVDDLPVRLVMLDTAVAGHAHGELGPDRLGWLDATLAAAPTRPTMLVMHHPPFRCGMDHLDAIGLRDASALGTVLGRHPQVERILCGHHHRAMTGRLGTAIVLVAPSVAHQGEFGLGRDIGGGFVLEPPAFQIHVWDDTGGLASHTVYVENFPGPFPFIADPDDPGRQP